MLIYVQFAQKGDQLPPQVGPSSSTQVRESSTYLSKRIFHTFFSNFLVTLKAWTKVCTKKQLANTWVNYPKTDVLAALSIEGDAAVTSAGALSAEGAIYCRCYCPS